MLDELGLELVGRPGIPFVYACPIECESLNLLACCVISGKTGILCRRCCPPHLRRSSTGGWWSPVCRWAAPGRLWAPAAFGRQSSEPPKSAPHPLEVTVLHLPDHHADLVLLPLDDSRPEHEVLLVAGGARGLVDTEWTRWLSHRHSSCPAQLGTLTPHRSSCCSPPAPASGFKKKSFWISWTFIWILGRIYIHCMGVAATVFQ